MSEVNWETLIERRRTDLKLSGLAAVHPDKVSLSQSDQHQTRIGAIRGAVRTDTKKYINPVIHRHQEL